MKNIEKLIKYDSMKDNINIVVAFSSTVLLLYEELNVLKLCEKQIQ